MNTFLRLVAVGLLCLVACSGGDAPRIEAVPLRTTPEAPIRTVKTFDSSVAATKRLGESASVGGRHECLSGLVIHGSSDPEKAWYCTVACSQPGDCPSSWACGEVYPGVRLCSAPVDWVPRHALPHDLEATP